MNFKIGLPMIALMSSALLATGIPPAAAQTAGTGARATTGAPRATTAAPRTVQHRHHHHRAPRVSIGVGVGFGGFYDPFFDPYPPFGYAPYGGYAYAPQPAVPCTPADVPKSEPTNNPFSPDYAYDRIDANRCSPQAIADATAAAQAQPHQPPAYYFCRGSNAYYPNVRECPGGWETVAPRPPGT